MTDKLYLKLWVWLVRKSTRHRYTPSSWRRMSCELRLHRGKYLIEPYTKSLDFYLNLQCCRIWICIEFGTRSEYFRSWPLSCLLQWFTSNIEAVIEFWVIFRIKFTLISWWISFTCTWEFWHRSWTIKPCELYLWTELRANKVARLAFLPQRTFRWLSLENCNRWWSKL